MHLSTNEIVVKSVDTNQHLDEVLLFTITDNIEGEFERKDYIELEATTFTPALDEAEELTLANKNVQCEDRSKYDHIESQSELEKLEAENEILKLELARAEDDEKAMEEELNKQIQLYKEVDLALSKLKNKYLRIKRSFIPVDKQRMLLSKVFSESQIKLLCGMKKICWTNDDMAVGYTIRHLSNRRCYVYLSKKLNIPLPAVSSIKRWMNLKHGPVKSLSVITNKVEKKEEEEEETIP